MKKSWAELLVAVAFVLSPVLSYADAASDILASLQVAREKLVALTGATDKDDQAELMEAVKTATQKVDQLVADSISSGPADLKGKASAFKAVWEEFKHTRDSEIIPAVLSGDKEKAKGLAQGIQAERFKKMQAALH